MGAPFTYFNRDLSWLSFNGTVLDEAAKPATPLLERINFLAIFSSNLDEFYRVRVPQLLAINIVNKTAASATSLLSGIQKTVNEQQLHFGSILHNKVIPGLKEANIELLYNKPLPGVLSKQLDAYFYTTLAAFLQITYLDKSTPLFLENNILYFAVVLEKDGREELAIVTIPSHEVSRFFSAPINETRYIVFIDDIIKAHLPAVFKGYAVKNAYSIKVTRNAELNLVDEFSGDIGEKIEAQLPNRDLGFATRVLHDPDIPQWALQQILTRCNLKNAVTMPGGHYHNLKDFFSFPVNESALKYPLAIPIQPVTGAGSIFETIRKEDLLVHTPYMSFDTILRFFNEAAIDADVSEISTTLYRIASDSKIAQALITAARNGKKVTVFVELKARFDEANNLKWAKAMKKAGINIIYSIPGLKVHAKISLIKREETGRLRYYGLLSTGNLNEKTARVYTDHMLLTADHRLLQELDLLFIFLAKRRKPVPAEEGLFNELMVAQFNLHHRFLELIDAEIANAAKGLPAAIRIKLNNLEEETLIDKLYEASAAGVQVQLIVRGICRLVPGVQGMSENITVKRIVDRYLEHGRVFIFNNNNAPLVWLGSSDWMNRNIYNRIEVCFPLYDQRLKETIETIFDMQWADEDAVLITTDQLQPAAVNTTGARSQQQIYTYLKKLCGN